MVAIVAQSSLNVSVAWYFNLFGAKDRISNLQKVQHVTIRKLVKISYGEEC